MGKKDMIEVSNKYEVAYLVSRGFEIVKQEKDANGYVKFWFDDKDVMTALGDYMLTKTTVKVRDFVNNLMNINRKIREVKHG